MDIGFFRSEEILDYNNCVLDILYYYSESIFKNDTDNEKSHELAQTIPPRKETRFPTERSWNWTSRHPNVGDDVWDEYLLVRGFA